MTRHYESPTELDVGNIFDHEGGPGPAPPAQPGSSPTLPPGARQCTPDQEGFFGTFAGDFTQLDYLYQVETIPTETPLKEEIINAIETHAIETLLPVLFSQECVDTSPTRKGGVDVRRKLELLGVSTQPPDKVVPFVACDGISDQDNNCFVVDGAMSLFGDDNAELEDSVTASREAIKIAMDSGAFDEIDDRIVKVTFLNKTLPVNGGGSTTEGTNSASDDGSSVPSYGWVFIALAPIVLGAVLIAWLRRRRRQQDLGGFPTANSDEDIPMGYEDPVLGITVNTPELNEHDQPSWAIIENRKGDVGGNEDDSLGSIGIEPKPLQPAKADTIIAAGSTPEKPDKWERLSLT